MALRYPRFLEGQRRATDARNLRGHFSEITRAMSVLLSMLSAETGLFEGDLLKIIRRAPRRYKTFLIPKRSGGMREIAQPAREVKLLQRAIVRRVLANLPIHDAAKAYRQGLSIRDNAKPHSGNSPILKMDFKDFFPSIRSADWEQYCTRNAVLMGEDIPYTSQILFRRVTGEHLLKLSIGAPSSPSLSNILLFDFDELVASEAAKRGILYTRYADDITFSGQRIGMLKDMVKVVEHSARRIERPSLSVNGKKATFITASMRRTVTGVILANDGTLSLGREKKRLISAKVHYASIGKLDLQDMIELAGQLSFSNVVEPQFILKLRVRYGDEGISVIQRAAALASTKSPSA